MLVLIISFYDFYSNMILITQTKCNQKNDARFQFILFSQEIC